MSFSFPYWFSNVGVKPLSLSLLANDDEWYATPPPPPLFQEYDIETHDLLLVVF
jgi:hypothetical protein